MVFISGKLIGSMSVMFYELKPCAHLVRPAALDDVLVKSEDDVRREFAGPRVQILGYAILFQPLVPVGECADIDLVFL